MSFASLNYLLFLAPVFFGYYLLGRRWRWVLLLAASVGFYAALKAPYLLAVLLVVAGISFVAGRQLAGGSTSAVRKTWFWGGVTANVLILAIVKYAPIVAGALPVPGLGTLAAGGAHSPWVTIGVSYYVFQAISYLADVHLGIIETEPHFGRFLLSLAFFPKLLQGPIERSGSILPQLRNPPEFDYEGVRRGLLLFGWGLFKKTVIADRLALYVNPVYDNVHHYSGVVLVVATYLYALQIFFDFSGYTDMALGSARLFGIRLTPNFNNPYVATSVADFWRRWHISFSSWILDYIFKPLQMLWRSARNWGTALALLVTFFVSGLWHGASLCFVIWGLLHGVYLASSVFWRPWEKKLLKRFGLAKNWVADGMRMAVTFNLVCLAWVFFRAGTLAAAWYILSHAFSGTALVRTALLSHGVGSVLLLAALLIPYFAMASRNEEAAMSRILALPAWARWSFYYGLLVGVLALGVFDQGQKFVYFRF